MEHTVDEFRAVPADDELLDAWPEESALDTERRTLPLVPLGIHHPDAGARHDDVVDVRARAGDAPIMQPAEGQTYGRASTTRPSKAT